MDPSSKEAALARVIEPSAPQSTPKRMRTADKWIPQLQKWDQEFLELPWEARQLIFAYSEPEDIKALCSASKLFNEYCKSSNLDDFWKKKIATLMELQKVRDAGLKFKKANFAWARDWILLKPIAQWSLDDFNNLFAQGRWGRLPVIDWGPRPSNAASWMHAWFNAQKVADKIQRHPLLKFLAKGYHDLTRGPSQYDRPEALRGLFLRSKVIDPPLVFENKLVDDKLSLLSEWNFQDPLFGRVVRFYAPLDEYSYDDEMGAALGEPQDFIITYQNASGDSQLILNYAWLHDDIGIKIEHANDRRISYIPPAFHRNWISIYSGKMESYQIDSSSVAITNPSRVLPEKILAGFRGSSDVSSDESSESSDDESSFEE